MIFHRGRGIVYSIRTPAINLFYNIYYVKLQTLLLITRQLQNYKIVLFNVCHFVSMFSQIMLTCLGMVCPVLGQIIVFVLDWDKCSYSDTLCLGVQVDTSPFTSYNTM